MLNFFINNKLYKFSQINVKELICVLTNIHNNNCNFMQLVGSIAPIGRKNIRLLRSFGRKAGKGFTEMRKTFAP